MPNILSLFTLLLIAMTPADRAGTVRIGLFSLFKPDVLHVRVAAGERAFLDAGSLRGVTSIAPGESVRVRLAGATLNVVLVDAYGRPRQSFNTLAARITPSDSGELELILPGKMNRVVRGDVSVAAAADKPHASLRIVLTTDRESAVASVVAAELGDSRAPEALKALAVIARTFMLSHAGRHADEGFDYCDTTHCQLYRGEADLSREDASPVIANAVARTANEYLSFSGKAIEGHYTAVCGGMSVTPQMVWGGSSPSGYPYGRVVCRWCRASRYSRWERRSAVGPVVDALSDFTGRELSQSAQIMVETDGADEFVRAVMIRDRARVTVISADQFRRAIGRRVGWSTVLSPTFSVERRGQIFIFRGRGFGSQAGLCLAGAVAQAEAGHSYREILRFYYPQAETLLK